MATSFSDMATAFGVDFGDIDRSALMARQLTIQQGENDDNRRERKETAKSQYLDNLDKDLAPSNTIHDFYSIPMAKSLKEEAYQLSSKNPNWSKEKIKREIQGKVKDAQYGIGMAKAYDKQILDEAERLEKEDEYFNSQKYIQDKRAAVFRNPETGEVYPIPKEDAFYDPKFDINDDNVRDNYLVQEKLDTDLQKLYKAGLEAQEGNEVGRDNLNRQGIWKYKANQMQTPYYDEDGYMVGAKFSPNTIAIGEKQFDILPTELQDPLSYTKQYQTKARLEKKRLMGEHPELADQPQEVIDRIVGANIAKKFVGSESTKATFDPEQQKYLDAKAQQALSNRYKANADARANRQAEINELKFKASQNEQKNAPTSYFNTIVDIAQGENPKGEKGKMMSPMQVNVAPELENFIANDIAASNPDIAKAYRDASKGDKQNIVKIYNISTFAKGKHIKDNQDKPIKAYMWVSPATGKRGIVEAEYVKDGNELKLYDRDENDAKRNPYRKPTGSINQMLQLYRPSFQNESKEEKETAIEKLTNPEDDAE